MTSIRSESKNINSKLSKTSSIPDAVKAVEADVDGVTGKPTGIKKTADGWRAIVKTKEELKEAELESQCTSTY